MGGLPKVSTGGDAHCCCDSCKSRSPSFVSSFADHELYIEDIADCLTSHLSDSYTLYLPDRFPRDTTCGRGGETVNGVIGTTLNLTINEGTYSADIVAKSKQKSDNVPYFRVKVDTQNYASMYIYGNKDILVYYPPTKLDSYVNKDSIYLDSYSKLLDNFFKRFYIRYGS